VSGSEATATIDRTDESYRRLAALAPLPLLCLSLAEARVVAANGAARELLGTSLDLPRLLGDGWAGLGGRLAVGEAVADQPVELATTPPRHVLLSGRAEAGVAVLTFTDITARVQAEAELRRRAFHFDLLAEYNEDVVWAMDRAGQFTYCGPGSLHLQGFTAEEVLERGLDVVAPGSLPVVLQRMEQAFAGTPTERGQHLEVELKHKNGATVWTEVSYAPFRDGQGQVVGIVGVTRDLTHRKAMEDELRHARDAAEAASRAKSEFLAVMSHEIRTPLNGILGLARVMLDQATEPMQRQALTILQEAGQGLLTVLNDILDFSKMEAGYVEFVAEPFQLAPVIESIHALMAPRAAEKGLEMTLAIDGAVPAFFTGDAQRLRQVLINLVSNAVKFTERGRILLAVRVVGLSAKAARLRFEVADTGPGIDAQARSRLFEPFTQADPTIARRFGGTGLGLAISKRIVAMLGGLIDLEPRAEGGTLAWIEIELPIATAHCAANAQPAASLPPLSILLAEDNPVNQLVAALLLRRQGHIVSVVEDGLAALEAVAEGEFDLVLMDMQMPGMDGIAATRAIRALSGGRGTLPIIAMTANAFHSDRELCLAAGMDDYVSKPIDLEALDRAIRQVLRIGKW